MSITILIAEDHYLIKQGLKAIIDENPGFLLLDDEIGLPEKWLSAIQRIQPTIFITDHQSYDQFIHQFPVLLQEISYHTNILIISNDETPSSIKSVIGSGVKGFLTKHCKASEIKDALYAIGSNKRFFCQEVMNVLLEEDIKYGTIKNLKKLTEREHEILKLIGLGLTSKEISEDLFISIHTVNSHRKNLLKKLNMKTPTQLILFAREYLP